jgi:hypothetical protein
MSFGTAQGKEALLVLLSEVTGGLPARALAADPGPPPACSPAPDAAMAHRRDGGKRTAIPASALPYRAARPAADPLPPAGTPQVLGIDLSGVPSRPSVTSANVA